MAGIRTLMEAAEHQIASQANSLAASLLAPASGVVSRFSDAVRKIAATLAKQQRLADAATVPVAQRYEANKTLMRYALGRLEARRAKLAKRIADAEGGLPRGGTARTHDISWDKLECIRIDEKLACYRAWESEGYDVGEIKVPNSSAPRFFADRDGYRFSFEVQKKFSRALLGGNTPCVKTVG